MNSKNHRTNHDFQIRYFLLGSCHTVDGGYALLCDLLDDRQLAINNYECNLLRNRANRMIAEQQRRSSDPAARLHAEAGIMALDRGEAFDKVLYEAALAEIATIRGFMAKLEPHRKFGHLPMVQAHEAAQRDEWRLELIYRAQNALVTSGTIPADHFATMRQHPDFEAAILPEINRALEDCKQARLAEQVAIPILKRESLLLALLES